MILDIYAFRVLSIAKVSINNQPKEPPPELEVSGSTNGPTLAFGVRLAAVSVAGSITDILEISTKLLLIGVLVLSKPSSGMLVKAPPKVYR